MHVCVNTIMGILEKTYYIILNLDFIHFYYVIYGGGTYETINCIDKYILLNYRGFFFRRGIQLYND